MEATALWRISIALGLLLLLLVAERRWPRRQESSQWRLRWTANLGLSLGSTVLVRGLLGAGAMGAAVLAQSKEWGVFAVLLLPEALEVLLSLVLLDLLIYGQHRLFHTLPLLWRLHRVHHSDLQVDATTALRFHPVEILLSMGLKMAAVIALGAPPLAVLAFEVLLNACAMFNHANLTLSPRLDRALRGLLITPDLHRVHHSVHGDEMRSNYGFSVPWWDHLFGSYRAQPRDGHTSMRLGVEQFRTQDEQRALALLAQPLRPV